MEKKTIVAKSGSLECDRSKSDTVVLTKKPFSINAYNFADLVMANTHFFEPLFLLDVVPAPKIEEIYRLHNKG